MLLSAILLPSMLLLFMLPTTWATLLLLTTTRSRVTLKFLVRLLGMPRQTALLLLKLVPSILLIRPLLSRVRSPTRVLLVLPIPKLFVLVSRSMLVLPLILLVLMKTHTSLVSPLLLKTRHIHQSHLNIVVLQDIHNKIKISQLESNIIHTCRLILKTYIYIDTCLIWPCHVASLCMTSRLQQCIRVV